MGRNIEKELKLYGYDEDPNEFKDTLGELHEQLYPQWTVEELEHHALEAHSFCCTVRRRLKSDIPDDLILRSLCNMRKGKHDSSYSPTHRESEERQAEKEIAAARSLHKRNGK